MLMRSTAWVSVLVSVCCAVVGTAAEATSAGTPEAWTLQDVKAGAETLESLGTLIGLLVGGIWVYLLFIQQRQRFPHAEISTDIASVELSPTFSLIHVATTIKNIGKALLPIREAHTWIQTIRPLDADLGLKLANGEDLVKEPGTEIPWPAAGPTRVFKYDPGEAELEPGESEILRCDFTIPRESEALLVYTWLRNSTKPDVTIGWTDSAIVEISTEEEVRVANHDGTGASDATQAPTDTPQT